MKVVGRRTHRLDAILCVAADKSGLSRGLYSLVFLIRVPQSRLPINRARFKRRNKPAATAAHTTWQASMTAPYLLKKKTAMYYVGFVRLSTKKVRCGLKKKKNELTNLGGLDDLSFALCCCSLRCCSIAWRLFSACSCSVSGGKPCSSLLRRLASSSSTSCRQVGRQAGVSCDDAATKRMANRILILLTQKTAFAGIAPTGFRRERR